MLINSALLNRQFCVLNPMELPPEIIYRFQSAAGVIIIYGISCQTYFLGMMLDIVLVRSSVGSVSVFIRQEDIRLHGTEAFERYNKR